MLGSLIDNRRPNSLATRSRKKRFQFFLQKLARFDRPLTILDVGGYEYFWETMDFVNEPGVSILLLNLKKATATYPNIQAVSGDARDLSCYEDNSFDVVFSNSVIEHLYDWDYQMQMANEIRRVGKHYFVQTPNRGFPVEPHFVFPFFQFLPDTLKVWLLTHFKLGHYPRYENKEDAWEVVREIKLLNERQMKKLFPECEIYRENIFGLTKSIVAHYMQADAAVPQLV